MSKERQLSDLPNYQPLGTVDPLDAYFAEKRGAWGDRAAQYISNTALQGGGLHLSPEAVEGIASRGRDEIIRKQGATPYVTALAHRLLAASDNRLISVIPTEKTALTSLFHEQYGVDLTPYMEQSTGMLGITGVGDRSKDPVIGLNYMAIHEGRGGNTFWRLTVNGVYGFVNMYCVRHDFPTMPITGNGNIAAIPGVEEALNADAAFIEQNH